MVSLPTVLCLDTEPITVDTLRDSGYLVETGEMGYRNGVPLLEIPPHEVDLIIWDLKTPACFDRKDWGPYGYNNNQRCKVVDSPTDETIQKADGSVSPRYQIIMESQLPKPPRGTFGPSDIRDAVGVAGKPTLLFLNQEWLQHVVFLSPNIAGFAWTFKPTTATRVQIESPLKDLLPELGESIQLNLPLNFYIEKGPMWHFPQPSFSTKEFPTIRNAVGQVFAQFIHCGKGGIFALPGTEGGNLPLINTLLDRLDALHRIDEPIPLIAGEIKPREVEIQSGTTRDVFISHASEDKDFAKPLAEVLIREGLTVWFDEYELTLGDSLLEKIEEGLRSSRYGVTILSHNFFRKPWPRRELDGLFALEKGEKKILPVWHNISLDEIRGYSSILAARLGISTSEGVEKVLKEILRAIQRD